MQKLLKVIGLSAVLAVVGLTTQAQKCKFDYEKKDPLTGKVTKKSTFTIVATVMFYTIERPLKWKLDVNKVGDKYFIGMFIGLTGSVKNPITPETAIFLKLSNGELITLYANDTYYSTTDVKQDGGVVSTYDAKFDISEEDMRKLAASPLIYVKVGIGARDYDSEFNVKKGTEFQNISKCILQ